MDILNQFGIKPVLLAAQVVNFLVLLFILKRFLYKPILKVLKQRQDIVAKSLKDAEEIEQRLQKTEEEREKKLEHAALESKKLIDEATQASTQIIVEAHLKASGDMEKILEQGRQSLKLEKEKMQQEIREELADLVAISLEKVLKDSLDIQTQKKITRKAIHKL